MDVDSHHLRIAFLFHKDPLGPAVGIDFVRLGALSAELTRLGAHVEIVAPVAPGGNRLGSVPVVPLTALTDRGRYDIIKACYHFALEHLDGYQGPLVCRLVRVVDEYAPARDDSMRGRLLVCQQTARTRASGLIFNNQENADRWHRHYGTDQPVVLVPTGCPEHLPPAEPSPYTDARPALLFLGSVVSPRMVRMLNAAAAHVGHRATVHVVGRDKTALYGGVSEPWAPQIIHHGEVSERETWRFVRAAAAGLALTVGPDRFDNDLSKITAYLRGGLPVVAESGVLNAEVPVRYGLGCVVPDDAPTAMAAAALSFRVTDAHRLAVMTRMATEHSWRQRALVLHDFLRRVAGQSP